MSIKEVFPGEKVTRENYKETNKLRKLSKKYEMDYDKLEKNYKRKIQKTKVKSRRKSDLTIKEKLQIAGAIGTIILSLVALKYVDNKYFDGKLTEEHVPYNQREGSTFLEDYMDPSTDLDELNEQYKGGK
jgi:hypothetical protein